MGDGGRLSAHGFWAFVVIEIRAGRKACLKDGSSKIQQCKHFLEFSRYFLIHVQGRTAIRGERREWDIV